VKTVLPPMNEVVLAEVLGGTLAERKPSPRRRVGPLLARVPVLSPSTTSSSAIRAPFHVVNSNAKVNLQCRKEHGLYAVELRWCHQPPLPLQAGLSGDGARCALHQVRCNRRRPRRATDWEKSDPRLSSRALGARAGSGARRSAAVRRGLQSRSRRAPSVAGSGVSSGVTPRPWCTGR